MTKTQFLREAIRQRRGRNLPDERTNIVRDRYGNTTGDVRDTYGLNARSGQFSAKLEELSETEREIFKAQIAKQLERERRLHKARSYLYSVSRHIQLYTAIKTLEAK